MKAQRHICMTMSVAVLLVACASALAWPEEKDRHGVIRDASGNIMRGVVTKLEPADPMTGFVARMLIEADPLKPDRREQVRVLIAAGTVIKMAMGKEAKRVKITDLKEGQRVQLVKLGGFLYSLPPVADAIEILILEEGK